MANLVVEIVSAGTHGKADRRLHAPRTRRRGPSYPVSMRTPRALPWLLALAPPLCLAGLVATHGVDVPFWDQWEFVGLLDRAHQGFPTLADLAVQHNEHRPFFPRLLMLALALPSGWNIRLELGLNLVLAALLFAVWVRLAAATARRAGLEPCPWLVPALSLAVFSLAQSENWTWGWQIQIFLNVLAVVLGFALLGGPPLAPARLAAAIACGVVASFSFSNGLLYWPIGLAVLAATAPGQRPEGLRRATALVLWTAAGALVFLGYFHGYQKPAAHPLLSLALREPGDLIAYIALYLGTPLLNFRAAWALGLGLAGIALFALGLARLVAARDTTRAAALLPLVGLASYSLASAAVTGIGRLGLGATQAMSSRYVTIALPFWLALLVILRATLPRPAAAGLTTVIVLFLGLTSIKSNGAFQSQRDRLLPAVTALRAGSHADPAIARLYSADIHPQLAILRRRHLSLFRETP
jgi:hypothetical protein